MVLVPTQSPSASMIGHDGKGVVRLYASGVCLTKLFDKPPSKPQNGQLTRRAELGGYWACLRPLSKRIAGNDTSFVEA